VKAALREIACVMCLNWVHTIEYNERFAENTQDSQLTVLYEFLRSLDKQVSVAE